MEENNKIEALVSEILKECQTREFTITEVEKLPNALRRRIIKNNAKNNANTTFSVAEWKNIRK